MAKFTAQNKYEKEFFTVFESLSTDGNARSGTVVYPDVLYTGVELSKILHDDAV